MGPLCRLTSARTTASQTGRSTSRPFLLQASSKNRRKGLSATGSQCTSHTRHTTNVSRPAQTGWTSTTADRDHMPRHPAPGPQPAPHLHLGGPTYAKKKASFKSTKWPGHYQESPFGGLPRPHSGGSLPALSPWPLEDTGQRAWPENRPGPDTNISRSSSPRPRTRPGFAAWPGPSPHSPTRAGGETPSPRRCPPDTAAAKAARSSLGKEKKKQRKKRERRKKIENGGEKKRCFCIPFDPSGLPVPHRHNKVPPRFRWRNPIPDSLRLLEPDGNPVSPTANWRGLIGPFTVLQGDWPTHS